MAESNVEQQHQYPNLNANGSGSAGSTASSYVESAKINAQNAMNSIANSQTVQDIQNGPVMEKARVEADQTKNEFSSLANSRTTPEAKTATGQSLTHYHSFFYNLLSWENPRATAISYISVVIFIFVTRYVPITSYVLRVTWITFGITAAAELVGHIALGQGLTSKIRPKKYYTIPRETLESMLEDVEQLTNFFVIEFQRILFAENVFTTVAAFSTALLTYWLVKIMPAWGLTLFFTTLVYFVPLGYTRNKELIDGHINNAGEIISQQTSQVRDLASQHTSRAMSVSQQAVRDYSTKAQELIGQTKKSAVEKGYVSQATADKITPSTSTSTTSAKVDSSDFPSAPSQEPAGPELTQAETHKAEPVLAQ